MTFNPEVSSINQRLQFGLETTPGVNVAASKLIQCYDLVFAPMAAVSPYTPTGRKYPAIVIENSEWVEGTLGGELDYNGVVYALAGVCGAPVIGAVGTSAVAKSWVFTPPLTGSVQPQTYTIEQGDSAIAGSPRKVNYALISEFGYKGDRKTGFTVSGKMLAQALQTGITMTSSPTAVALQPTAGKHFNYYLDSTSAGLGTTFLSRVLNVDFLFSNLYGMLFPFNRANLGFTTHVDLKPTAVIKVLMEADSVGMSQLAILEAGTTQFLRVQAQGPIIDNIQTVTFGGGATGGTFSLSYKGQTTAPITYSAALTAATIQTAFQLLSTVGVNYAVSGSAGGPYTFTPSGGLANDMSPISATNISLTGGTPTLTVAALAYALFQHDMAVKISNPTPFQDKDGVFAEEWEFTVVEDSTWGKSHLFTIQTLLTAL